MGACASKQNVLNCEAPEVKPENAAANSVGLVIKKDVAKNDETLIAEDGDSDKNPSLDNLLNVCCSYFVAQSICVSLYFSSL